MNNRNIDRLRDDVVREAHGLVSALRENTNETAPGQRRYHSEDVYKPVVDARVRLEHAVSLYEAATTPKCGVWMPVETALPEHGTFRKVLVTIEAIPRGVLGATLTEWKQDHFNCDGSVIAWMPLPEPYK